MTPTTATITPEVVSIMTRLTAAGVRLSPNGANLRFSVEGALAPDLRELIIAHKAELHAALSVWCPKRALVLSEEVTALIERLGVSGRDAVIQEAAQQYAAAANNHDMAAVRAALHTIEGRARKLAAATNTGRNDHA